MSLSLSKAFMDLNVAMNTIIKLQGKLIDQAFFNDINDIKDLARTMMNGFTQATGKALHRLGTSEPSEDTVKQMVEGIPSSLTYKCATSQMLPVQSAVWHVNSIKYLPILAKEGIKHNVGGIDKRGGLLVADPSRNDYNYNTLQLLVSVSDPSNAIAFDTACLNAMKELRKAGLLVKTDIKELLYLACHTTSRMRFEYLAEWDSDSLMATTHDGVPYVHHIINGPSSLVSFTMYLRASLKYYPRQIGCLFLKDSDGKTTIRRAIEKNGRDKTFKAIQECIPADTTLPILHHAAIDAPEYFNEFSVRYPSAIYLRDENGRSFTQAQLAAGTKTIETDGLLFLKLSDDEIAEVDPVTKQYPFLTAATAGTGNLLTVYFLLSKNPSLLDRFREQVTRERTE
eukprot:scaffold2563_cov201-Chaetoceros_neogracile.AAC.4